MLSTFLDAVKWVLANYQAVITSVAAVVAALIGLFALVPGDQPEKFLHAVADFIGKFSRKPTDPTDASK